MAYRDTPVCDKAHPSSMRNDFRREKRHLLYFAHFVLIFFLLPCKLRLLQAGNKESLVLAGEEVHINKLHLLRISNHVISGITEKASAVMTSTGIISELFILPFKTSTKLRTVPTMYRRAKIPQIKYKPIFLPYKINMNGINAIGKTNKK